MKKLATITMTFILIVTTVFSFDINTTLFDQRIDNGDGYKEIVFKNKYTESVRYKIKVIKSGENGKDMSNWVEVSPTIVNIQPLSEKVLKIFVKAPKEAKKGEYSFKLQVEPIVIPTISKAKEGGVKGNSSVTFVPIIQMFGYVGDPDFKKNINLENMKLEKVNKEYILTGILVNNAYAGKNIGFNFIGDNNFIVEGKWIGRLNPNFKQKISIKVKDKFKEISIYDAESNKEIKRISIPKST
ncbi:MAG: hypothetical protein ACRDBY_10165 [Cetobacterium sp.]